MALIRGFRVVGMVVHNTGQTTLKHRFEGLLWRKLSVGSRPIVVGHEHLANSHNRPKAEVTAYGLNVSNAALGVLELYNSEDS
jgi:hypothetical protein